MNHTKTTEYKINRTGARVSSPSSGVRPGARALNLELPTSFGFRLFMGALCLLAGSFLFGNVFLPHSAYAASYLNVSSGGAVSLGSIRPTSSGTSSTGSDTLTVHTDCSAGYSVYVSGQNGKDTNLTNSSAESNNTISTSSNAIGSAGSLSSNTWGLNSENTGAYVGLPTYANATNKALTTKTSVAESSTVPIYYGIKVDTSVTPGTYTGDVLYTVLPNSACTTYTVRFNANGGSGTMNNQTITVGKATNLTMNAFTRSGYMFLGWATSPSATTPTYKDGESVTDITNFNPVIDLYAVWRQSTGNMQDFQCTNLTPNTTTYLTDTRDNQVYSVYRWPTTGTAGTDYPTDMAGACLMTKDLSLGYVTGGSVTSGSNLSLTTDASNFDANASNSRYETIDLSGTQTVTHVNSANSGAGWSTDDTYTNMQYTNGPQSGKEAYSSHSYYSWGAALVVCPKGWRLPTGVEYGRIAVFMGGDNSTDSVDKIRGAPYDFVFGGLFESSGWDGAGSDEGKYGVGKEGNYWSSAQGGRDGYATYLYIFSSRLSTLSYGKYNGMSVRCVAQDNYTVNYSADGAESGSPSKTTEGTVYESGSVTMPTVGTMTKSGYEFKGWALTSGATEAAYAAEETVALSALLTAASAAGQSTTAGSTITLYPVWEKSIAYMQDFICSTLTAGTSTTLVDARDNQEYSVYRFPTDVKYAGTSTVANVAGKCIMTKDLNLGAVASVSGASSSITANGTMTLSPEDSGFTTPTGSGESITVPTSNVTVSNGADSWGSNSNTYNTYTNRKYTTGGTGNYAGRGYYTWGAAMVACPKNWRLPTADEYSNSTSWEGQTAGLAAVVKGSNGTATISNITGSPYSFVLDGSYNGSFNDATANGYYWSSVQHNSTASYYLHMNSSLGLELYSYNKYTGFAVRCIADVDGTMQDFDASTFSATVGTSANLLDTRDGKVYAVKRLPDGKVWMMQNLTINGVVLTKDDTNIDNNTTYYLPKDGGAGSITDASTKTATTGYNFTNGQDNKAMFKFRSKNSSYTNDSDTGYYNFYTATLGFSYYGDNVSKGSSTRDICPKGWRLPHTTDAGTTVSTIDTNNDFTYLTKQYSTSNWSGTATSYNYYTTNSTAMNSMYKSAASPLATTTQNNYAGFSYAGLYSGTSLGDLGSRGYYWSSSVSTTSNGYNLSFNSSNVSPQSSYDKYYGFAVRCVAKS